MCKSKESTTDCLFISALIQFPQIVPSNRIHTSPHFSEEFEVTTIRKVSENV